MQTASADCSDVGNSKSLSARVLFDSDSQRSYVSLDMCAKLGLKSLRNERVNIKSFGEDNWKIRNLQVFQLKVKRKGGNDFCLIEA